MKKLIILALFSFALKMSFSEDIKSYFYVKVVDGDPFALEVLCIESFGDSFSYGNTSKVFSLEATAKAKVEFLNKIKEEGFTLTTSSEKDAFEVSIKKVEPSSKKYHIKTYMFSEEELLAVQKIFKSNLTGSDIEYVNVDNADIASIKVALKKMGFDCTFGIGEIFIRQSEYSFEIKYPDFIDSADILAILKDYATKTQELMESFRITITKPKLMDLIANLESLPLVKEIKLVESNKLEFVEREKTEYKLVVYLSSKSNARKLKEAFEKSESFGLEDSFVLEEKGTMSMELTISTYDENKEEVFADVSSLARRVLPSLRTRDLEFSLIKK